MNITCPHCSAKLNIPDEKIPRDRDTAFKCPKCRESVQIKAARQGGISGKSASESGGGAPGSHQADVLICMENEKARALAMEAVQQAGWTAEVALSVAQSLEKMEYQIYPLVLMDDSFNADAQMAAYLNELDMSLRRRICLVLVCRDSETGDPMAAMHASSNFVVNTRDAGQRGKSFFSGILSNARSDHKNFYRVYNDSMKAAGKA